MEKLSCARVQEEKNNKQDQGQYKIKFVIPESRNSILRICCDSIVTAHFAETKFSPRNLMSSTDVLEDALLNKNLIMATVIQLAKFRIAHLTLSSWGLFQEA